MREAVGTSSRVCAASCSAMARARAIPWAMALTEPPSSWMTMPRARLTDLLDGLEHGERLEPLATQTHHQHGADVRVGRRVPQGAEGELPVLADLAAAISVAGRHAPPDPARDLGRHLRGADAGRQNQHMIPDTHPAVGASISLEDHRVPLVPAVRAPTVPTRRKRPRRASETTQGPPACQQPAEPAPIRFRSASRPFPVDGTGLLGHTFIHNHPGMSHGTTQTRFTHLFRPPPPDASAALAPGRHGGCGGLPAATGVGAGFRDVEVRSDDTLPEDLVEHLHAGAG